MNKALLFFIPLIILATACKKEKTDVIPQASSKFAMFENPKQFELMDISNWEEKMLVGNLRETDKQEAGEDTMYAFSNNGRAYLKYGGKDYIVIATDEYGEIQDNASAYTIAIYDSQYKLMCYGHANPSRSLQAGQWVPQKQNFHVDYSKHPLNAPFNKILEGIYMER